MPFTRNPFHQPALWDELGGPPEKLQLNVDYAALELRTLGSLPASPPEDVHATIQSSDLACVHGFIVCTKCAEPSKAPSAVPGGQHLKYPAVVSRFRRRSGKWEVVQVEPEIRALVELLDGNGSVLGEDLCSLVELDGNHFLANGAKILAKQSGYVRGLRVTLPDGRSQIASIYAYAKLGYFTFPSNWPLESSWQSAS